MVCIETRGDRDVDRMNNGQAEISRNSDPCHFQSAAVPEARIEAAASPTRSTEARLSSNLSVPYLGTLR
jgi:hypothetical protein